MTIPHFDPTNGHDDSRGATPMSERMMTIEQYDALDTRPSIADIPWREPAITAEETIAAEIQVAISHMQYVETWALHKLDACETSALGIALTTLRELHGALTA